MCRVRNHGNDLRVRHVWFERHRELPDDGTGRGIAYIPGPLIQFPAGVNDALHGVGTARHVDRAVEYRRARRPGAAWVRERDRK